MSAAMSATARPRSVAIVGGGPAGLALALFCLKQGIHCQIYEGRLAKFEARAAHAALSLQPNGLRTLDDIGMYTRLRPRGFSIDVMNISDIVTGKSITEGEGIESAYGYKPLRIYRRLLIEELQAAVAEKGLNVQYGHKFSHIVSESVSGVTFAFADGSQKTADLLVGTDGINSRVRQYVAPDVKATYSGFVALGAEVSRSALRFSAESPEERLPLMTKSGKTIVMLVPQDSDGSKLFCGRGKNLEVRSQEEWNALEADKNAVKEFYEEGLDGWPDIVHSAVENINIDGAYIWPVHTMPRLDNWISKGKRVAILGDAAHAVSPITGQGVNQAFEDAYMLAAVLANVPQGRSTGDALAFWQEERTKRVHEMVDRLIGPGSGKDPQLEAMSRIAARPSAAGGRPDAWLYETNFEKVVGDWAKSAT